MDIKNVSAAVLAGGFSSRMGRSKAELELGGRSLISLQAEKLRKLGISDIIVSGYDKPVEGTRFVPDIYPHRGPVSGIHACLKAAAGKACFFISVDVPLIPAETIAGLIEAHSGGITVLVHGEKLEPLMAVYDCSLWHEAEEILQSEKTAVMKLVDRGGAVKYEYHGDELLLSNCNTPEQFETIKQYSLNMNL